MVRAVILVALATAGCAYNHHALVQRASADLSCPEGQLEVVRTDSEHRTVSGCGHQARYTVGESGWVASELDGRATPAAVDAGAPGLTSEPPPSAIEPVPPLVK